jgi:phage terminase large subunit-like protein
LFTALKNSTDARPNGFQVITSTAGWNKIGAFYKLVQYSRDILSGKIIDPTFQPWIFEVPEGADLDDRRNWYLANPSLGITQSEADFAGQWERERRDGSTKLAFQRLKFNMWTDAENAWVSPEAFDACRGDTTIPGGTPVVLAADIGATRDLTAISLVARVGERIVVKTWGFVPSGYTNTRDNANTVKYQQFANEGGLEITPGTATDLDYIMKKLDGLCSRYKVQAVVFDRWQSLPLANHLSRKGVPTFNFPQTHSYFNAPCLEFERLVNSRKVVHDGSGLLRWQIGHTYLTRDSKGYVKPESASPPLKKDNLIATLMGLSQCLQAGEAKPSVYESQGVFVL